MGMTGISKSQVSQLCAEIDARVRACLDRPIEGLPGRLGERGPNPAPTGQWPYLWIDATYVKVREAGRGAPGRPPEVAPGSQPRVSVAVIIAVGVNTDGRREVLGLAVGPSEAEPFWTAFLRSLMRRGLRGVKLVVSDAHEGLKAAAAKVLHATWQRCRVHVLRNLLAHVGPSQRAMVAAAIRTVFTQENQEAARRQWRQVADGLRARFERLAKAMDSAEDDVLAYMTFHTDHWAKISSTNPLERLIGEIKRRTDVVGIFPNEAAIIRLVGALLLEQRPSPRSAILSPSGYPPWPPDPGTDPPETTTVKPLLHHPLGHDPPRGGQRPRSRWTSGRTSISIHLPARRATARC
jgi:putative transposase